VIGASARIVSSVNDEAASLNINLGDILWIDPSCAPMPKRADTTLPSPHTRRWTIRRKAALLEAIRSGGITLEQAGERYALSIEELRSWERYFERHGLPGLRTTRLQTYRNGEKARR
jgi:Protein of unknown function (DUF1153)